MVSTTENYVRNSMRPALQRQFQIKLSGRGSGKRSLNETGNAAPCRAVSAPQISISTIDGVARCWRPSAGLRRRSTTRSTYNCSVPRITPTRQSTNQRCSPRLTRWWALSRSAARTVWREPNTLRTSAERQVNAPSDQRWEQPCLIFDLRERTEARNFYALTQRSWPALQIARSHVPCTRAVPRMWVGHSQSRTIGIWYETRTIRCARQSRTAAARDSPGTRPRREVMWCLLSKLAGVPPLP